jgi:heptaprenyl diphosphate synthase
MMRKAKEESLCAILLALALALTYVERLIPLQLVIPLPGIKLGLANIVTLVVLYTLKTRYAFLILVPRCCFTAAFGGGATGFWFSLCGGLLALVVMSLAKKAVFLSVFGVSMIGAAAHNIGQIMAAMVLMNSVYIGAYLPYLLIVAIVTGLITGGICAGVLRVLPKALASAPGGQ